MSDYRRCFQGGATYFFTVVTHRRQSILTDTPLRRALREAIVAVRQQVPFAIDAWVLLPDHLHCLWTLPAGDAKFGRRWSAIKRRVTQAVASDYAHPEWRNAARIRRRESTIWQRRFWEHGIRDEADFSRHLDYLLFNPVKHGLVSAVVDWPYSSFHRLVRAGMYPAAWGGESGVGKIDGGEVGDGARGAPYG